MQYATPAVTRKATQRIAELIAEHGIAWNTFAKDAVLNELGFSGVEQIRSCWRRHGDTYDPQSIRSEPASNEVIPNADLISTIVDRVIHELGVSPQVQPVAAPAPTIAANAREMPSAGREVALYDIHHPHHDKAAWASVLAFLKDYKPDVVILAGDAMDAGPFSRWSEKKLGLLRTMPPAFAMFGTFNTEILRPIRDAVGSAHITYLLGNHEDWIRQAIEADPRGEGFWEVERNLDGLVDAVVPYVSENRHNHINIGKLYFTHGYVTNLYHARKVADDYNRPVRYGHTHDMQLYTHRTAVDVNDFHIARSCGCLCNLNPSYAKNRPNRWVHGFQYGEVDDTGAFADEVPVIINGRFKAEGVWYGH